MGNVRALEKEDIKKCLQICKENFKELKYDWIDDVEKKFIESLDENNIFQLSFFVFEENNVIKGIIGMSNVIFSGSIYGLLNLYIAIEHQNQ
jgi:predicted N-acetyltransferase YhbS